ncbi:hypothetical protein GWI33_007068 [Rhynchophorus ferrugineus]|uniref:Uncharacterized protein n=1 Tax=Rhynchophorus ferrugineus TaxID=354439 RepID=A0A834IF26_RHYFE|nr:hypothetical protein GWI33_007068 [Rhynchophorus ferrugineus]
MRDQSEYQPLGELLFMSDPSHNQEKGGSLSRANVTDQESRCVGSILYPNIKLFLAVVEILKFRTEPVTAFISPHSNYDELDAFLMLF